MIKTLSHQYFSMQPYQNIYFYFQLSLEMNVYSIKHPSFITKIIKWEHHAILLKNKLMHYTHTSHSDKQARTIAVMIRIRAYTLGSTAAIANTFHPNNIANTV